jgi:hypothetical protein
VHNEAFANTAMTMVCSSSRIHTWRQKNSEAGERHTKLHPFIDFADPLELVRMSVVMRAIFLSYQQDLDKGPVLSEESVNTQLLKQ